MDVRVLGANASNTSVATLATGAEDSEGDTWLMAPGSSCNFGEPYNGTDTVKLLGKLKSSEDCKAKCAAYNAGGERCKSFSWCSAGCGGEWANTCYGRLDDQWELMIVQSAVSGCDRSLSKCVPPPPPPPPSLAVRTFAHCSKLRRGAVMFAVAATPCVRNESIDLHFPGATNLTTWWLSALSPADDMISLNGRNLTVSVTAPLPDLEGEAQQGGGATMPASGVCTVGFVEAQYETAVEACL